MSKTATGPPQERLGEDDVRAIDRLREVYAGLRKELGRVIVGQRDVIERLSICLFARGHALLMGVPGLAKTLLVSKVAETMSLKFSRIQFTPDLMPMDITGTDILQDGATGRREFHFVHGPVFANIVLANVLGMLMGFMLGVLFRSSAGAIVGYFVYSLVLPVAFGTLAAFQEWFRDLQPWVDVNFAVTRLFDQTMTTEYWQQLAVATLVWLWIPLALGLRAVLRAEVK